MPVLDAQLVLSDAQAITATAVSTNVIDLAVAGRGKGNKLELYTVLNQSFNTLTSLEFQVQSCASAGFGSGVVTHQKVSYALASLVAGFKPALGYIPEDALAFVRLNYVVTGSNPTTGQVTAAIAPFGAHA